MYLNNPELMDRPELPQYGRELAVCQAELALPPAIWVRIAITFASFVGFTWLAVMLSGVLPLHPVTPPFLVSLSICGPIVVWFLTNTLRGQLQPTPVFVFEKGIHLSESVLYTVPGGHRLSICRGVRHVSLPWRVLQKVSGVGKSDSPSPAELYVQLPDGRKLRFASEQGPESAVAVNQLRRNVSQ